MEAFMSLMAWKWVPSYRKYAAIIRPIWLWSWHIQEFHNQLQQGFPNIFKTISFWPLKVPHQYPTPIWKQQIKKKQQGNVYVLHRSLLRFKICS
jgi:hypothetical protein